MYNIRGMLHACMHACLNYDLVGINPTDNIRVAFRGGEVKRCSLVLVRPIRADVILEESLKHLHVVRGGRRPQLPLGQAGFDMGPVKRLVVL